MKNEFKTWFHWLLLVTRTKDIMSPEKQPTATTNNTIQLLHQRLTQVKLSEVECCCLLASIGLGTAPGSTMRISDVSLNECGGYSRDHHACVSKVQDLKDWVASASLAYGLLNLILLSSH